MEEGGLKSILHALLVSGGPGDKGSTGGKERGADGVERLSLKGCKKIREKGWGLIAEYLKMVRSTSPHCCLEYAAHLGFFLRFTLVMTGKEFETSRFIRNGMGPKIDGGACQSSERTLLFRRLSIDLFAFYFYSRFCFERRAE